MSDIEAEVERLEEEIGSVEDGKKERLRNLDFFCLDNSIRESTVGQLRSHTIENKKIIFEQAKKCGFKEIVVASFSNMTRVDDYFCEYLKEQGEDFSCLFSFSEISNGIVNGVYDEESIPVSLVKNKKYGIYNTFFELDLNDDNCDWDGEWTLEQTCKLVEKWMDWVYDNINDKARILINIRDLADTINEFPERVVAFVTFLAKMPEHKRMFCLAFEDPLGEFLPEEVAAWTACLRRTMDRNGWQDGRLICHIHEKWGLQNASQIDALAAGADGIWASLCEEGAAMGHACSSVTITNLVRLGNEKVLDKYNCSHVRQAAQIVTQATTNKPAHPKQVVYGERAVDLVFGGLGTGKFDLADFFGVPRTNRMTTLASPEMIRDHLVNCFGEDEQFTLEISATMKAKMLEDLHELRKEEYQSPVGIAILFDRVGGTLTGKMAEAIAKEKLTDVHHHEIVNEIKAVWDEWDVRNDRPDDDCLEFDSFYNAFASPYLGCYRCTRAKQAFSALDMDNDGLVHWDEFSVYLKWALRQYPEIESGDELLSTAFQKGILPAMQDEQASQIRKSMEEAKKNEKEEEEEEGKKHHGGKKLSRLERQQQRLENRRQKQEQRKQRMANRRQNKGKGKK